MDCPEYPRTVDGAALAVGDSAAAVDAEAVSLGEFTALYRRGSAAASPGYAEAVSLGEFTALAGALASVAAC